MDLIDLRRADHAYLFGFLQGDGHLSETTRNRGRLTVELAERDAAILERLAGVLPCRSHLSFRTRNTNFRTGARTAVWSFHDRSMREEFKKLGFPVGCKSDDVRP